MLLEYGQPVLMHSKRIIAIYASEFTSGESIPIGAGDLNDSDRW